MDFDIGRWMGRSQKPDGNNARVSPTENDGRGYSGALVNVPQAPSRKPCELKATIVAVLDRDSKLRHDYLLKCWQCISAVD